jgi:hypothetical protein
MYQTLPIAIGAAAPRSVCSLRTTVGLVPVAHGLEIGVFADPILDQLLEGGSLIIISPMWYNMQNQYSFEEQTI